MAISWPPVSRQLEQSSRLLGGSPHRSLLRRGELLERAAPVFEWIAEGKLDVRIVARYPLSDARQADEDLEARRTTGKLILLP